MLLKHIFYTTNPNIKNKMAATVAAVTAYGNCERACSILLIPQHFAVSTVVSEKKHALHPKAAPDNKAPVQRYILASHAAASGNTIGIVKAGTPQLFPVQKASAATRINTITGNVLLLSKGATLVTTYSARPIFSKAVFTNNAVIIMKNICAISAHPLNRQSTHS